MERFLKPKWIFACLFVIVLLSLLYDRKPVEITSLSGKTMGTSYSIKYLDNGHGIKPLGISKDINELLKKINQHMSTYIKDSELSKFNKSSLTQWQKISPELYRALEHALSVAKKTNGAFDPTIGPLVNLWGFGPDKKRIMPTLKLIEKVKRRVGYNYIQLQKSPPQVMKSRSDVYLDLSASAKGYGVDAVSMHLLKIGIENHMVEIGGEVRTAGSKAGRPWKIGIEAPGPNYTLEKKIVKLKNMSLATSGSYRNYFDLDGKKYSHVIDFRTGKPVSHTLASVSVVSKKGCMDADAWATALMVLGPVKGLELAKKLKIGAFFIYKKNDQPAKKFMEIMTPKFRELVESN
ncbi:MAG: FAD:protein FMN transferase [Bacteriovoracaceae bacterium]|jgi:FAD:protein FMN transferase|nr:FAD:protein FMN transferase [Bacteriovoracaceae bacterium]